MRLLTPEEHGKRVEAEERAERKRLESIRDTITVSTKELSKIKDDTFFEKERVISEHRKWVAEREEERRRLDAEVSALEERRREVMKPVAALKAELEERARALDERNDSLSAFEERLLRKTDELADLSSRLEDKEVDLAEKSSSLASRERKLADDKEEFRKQVIDKEFLIKEERADLRRLFEEADKKSKQK